MPLRKLLLPIALLLAALAAVTAAAGAAGAATAATAVPGTTPVIHTNRGCYLVGQPVEITGTGFLPSSPIAAMIDGPTFFGTTTTDANGDFSTAGTPGGLGPNFPQFIHTIKVSDGMSTASAVITVTRTPGARIFQSTGRTLATFRARFQVWGFGLVNGRPPAVDPNPQQLYVHYVGPRGGLRTTIAIGRSGGECGYLRTTPRRVFPFAAIAGVWKLQVDTSRAYSRHPKGPVARIALKVA